MSKLRNTPFQLSLIITRNCNLSCLYCYEHNKEEQKMSGDIAKQYIKKYLTTGNYEEIQISFFGGEPLLEFDLIKDLCEWTWSQEWPKKYLFFANTNGTLISDDIKKWFTINKEYFWLGLSLDGTRKTHNINRSNSFDKIDLDFFHSRWPEQSVKMTITDKNLNHLADDIIFIHEQGFRLSGCNFAEGIDISDFENNIQIIAEQLHLLTDYYLKHPDREISPLLNIPLELCEKSNGVKKKHCGIGENIAVIDIDGTVYPCTYFSSLSLSEKQLEDVKDLDFSNTDVFVNNDCFDKCYLFPICYGCYGDNYTSTGSLNKRSVQKCELTKLRAVAFSNFKAKEILQKKDRTRISQKDLIIINSIKRINELIDFQIT